MHTSRCQRCGSTEFVGYVDGTIRCKICGTIVSPISADLGSSVSRGINNLGDNISSGTKNRLIAILLAFFLGGLGGQYFYFGKYLKAVICIIFSWTCIPMLWGIIHAIILLAMSDEKFNSKYN